MDLDLDLDRDRRDKLGNLDSVRAFRILKPTNQRFPVQIMILNRMEKTMVDATQAMESSYMTAELVKQLKDKTAQIVSEGKYEETNYDGKKSQRLTLTINIDEREKIWRPNRDSVKNLAEAYGRDTKLWYQKVVLLSVISIMGKDSIIATPA